MLGSGVAPVNLEPAVPSGASGRDKRPPPFRSPPARRHSLDKICRGGHNLLVSPQFVRIIGLAVTIAYAAFIGWLYGQQPRTMAEVRGGVAATLGVYQIDQRSFDEGLRFFRNDQFAEARSAFERADPADRDPTTQFYIGYAYYREGWGRVYHDDGLYRKGLEAVNRAIQVAPGGRVVADDPTLGMRTGDELKAEIERGLTRDITDLNPLRLFHQRK